jgi:hypothetical protein
MLLPEAKQWERAEQAEKESMKTKQVLGALGPLPNGADFITTRFIYKLKLLADNAIDKFKARLIGHGNLQADHTFGECYCPPCLQ